MTIILYFPCICFSLHLVGTSPRFKHVKLRTNELLLQSYEITLCIFRETNLVYNLFKYSGNTRTMTTLK